MKYYDDLIQGLRSEIESRFGSVAAFCRENNVSRQNLSEVFSGRQEISVGLYLRICCSLNVVGTLPTASLGCNVPLRQYLAVDHDVLVNSLLKLLLEN